MPSSKLAQPASVHVPDVPAVAAWNTIVAPEAAPESGPLIDPVIVDLQRALRGLGMYHRAISGELDEDTHDAMARLSRLAGFPAAGNLAEANAQIALARGIVQRRRPVAPRHLISAAAPDAVLLMFKGEDLEDYRRIISGMLDDTAPLSATSATLPTGLDIRGTASVARLSASSALCRYFDASVEIIGLTVTLPRAHACRVNGRWQLADAQS